jgi:hypothetical protein
MSNLDARYVNHSIAAAAAGKSWKELQSSYIIQIAQNLTKKFFIFVYFAN